MSELSQAVAKYPFKLPPFQHQLSGMEFYLETGNRAIFAEMGTGKSKVAIDVAGFLFLCKRIQGLVVIAPKGVYRNWLKKEIPGHMSEVVPYEFARWTSYMLQDDRAALASLMKPSSALKVLAINIEALSGDPTKLKKGKYPALEYLINFLKQYPSLVVCDESTTIKNPTAQRTKTVVAIGNKMSKNTMALSGNPIPQSPLDMYSQSEFLGHRTLPFENFYAFKNRFAITVPQYGASGKMFNKVVGFQDKQELRRLMRSFAFVVKKKDCLDLPEKLYQTRDIEMGPLQKVAYNKMVMDSFIELESMEIITANIVLTKMQKLHQIACGFIYDSERNVVTFNERNDRLETLLEDLEQIPQKAIIWSHFVPCIEVVVEALGKKFGKESVAHFYGKTTDAEREEYKVLFEDPDSKVKFMVANPSSGKYGNTWLQGTTVYYYSNSNNLEDRQQSEDRSHRIGQKSSVLYVDLVVPDTEDEKTLARLQNKVQLSNEIVVSNWREMIGRAVA